MAKFPVDAPSDRVLRALQALGFEVVRRGNHISLARTESDGTVSPLTLPGHRNIKGSMVDTDEITPARKPGENPRGRRRSESVRFAM